MEVWEVLMQWGVPAGITGFIIWIFKRSIEKKDKEKEERQLEKEREREKAEKEKEERERIAKEAAEERERNIETLMLMIMQTCRANTVLAEATARAVQRIPDAHCNGDMTSALKQAEKIQKEEQQFLIDKGVKYIFGNANEV